MAIFRSLKEKYIVLLSLLLLLVIIVIITLIIEQYLANADPFQYKNIIES